MRGLPSSTVPLAVASSLPTRVASRGTDTDFPPPSRAKVKEPAHGRQSVAPGAANGPELWTEPVAGTPV